MWKKEMLTILAQDYDRSRADAAVMAGLRDLRADGEMFDIVAKLAPVEV